MSESVNNSTTNQTLSNQLHLQNSSLLANAAKAGSENTVHTTNSKPSDSDPALSHQNLQALQQANTQSPYPTCDASPTYSLKEAQSGAVYQSEMKPIAQNQSTENDFEYYKSVIEANGGTFHEGVNERNLLGIRRESSTNANSGKGEYNDTLIMLWKDAEGNNNVEIFDFNTEPSARYEGREGVDADGDGSRDLGRLPAGYYEFKTSTSEKFGNVLRPTSSVMAERDTDKDGYFDENKSASAGRSIIFHKGGRNITGSAGCQTLKPEEFSDFWDTLTNAGTPETIGYTLVHERMEAVED